MSGPANTRPEPAVIPYDPGLIRVNRLAGAATGDHGGGRPKTWPPPFARSSRANSWASGFVLQQSELPQAGPPPVWSEECLQLNFIAPHRRRALDGAVGKNKSAGREASGFASGAARVIASRSRIRSSVRVSGARTDATLFRQPEATLEHIHAPPLMRHHDGRRPAGVQRRGHR